MSGSRVKKQRRKNLQTVDVECLGLERRLIKNYSFARAYGASMGVAVHSTISGRFPSRPNSALDAGRQWHTRLTTTALPSSCSKPYLIGHSAACGACPCSLFCVRGRPPTICNHCRRVGAHVPSYSTTLPHYVPTAQFPTKRVPLNCPLFLYTEGDASPECACQEKTTVTHVYYRKGPRAVTLWGKRKRPEPSAYKAHLVRHQHKKKRKARNQRDQQTDLRFKARRGTPYRKGT